MTLRARIFIVISLAVLLVLAISLLLVVRSQKQSGASNQSGAVINRFFSRDNTNAPASPLDAESRAPVAAPRIMSPAETGQNAVKQLAKIFIERYGTYSTDNNFDNIREVESLATDELWARISRRISGPSATDEFVGVTTKVITTELVGYADSAAEVALKVMRSENKAGAVSTSYSDAKVWLIKTGNEWKVERFEMK